MLPFVKPEHQGIIKLKDDRALPVVMALLLNHGEYVLQLRDKGDGVSDPGLWGLFGGSRKDYEDHKTALRREVKEELEITLGELAIFCETQYGFVFISDISSCFEQIKLHEGRGYASLSYEELDGLQLATTARAVIDRHYLECHI